MIRRSPTPLSKCRGPTRSTLPRVRGAPSDGVGRDTAIVFAMDRAYVHPMSVALTSLATSGRLAQSNAIVRILHSNLTKDQQALLTGLCSALDLRMEFVHVSLDAENFPLGMWFTPAVYTRLHLASAAEGVSRLLYLDCDVIAVDDIGDLLATEPGDIVAAVRDPGNPLMSCGQAVPGYEKLGIPADREYFNVGVLLVNVDGWKRNKISERCRAFLGDKREHIRFADQDALNVVIADGWRRLPLEWNVFPLSAIGHEEAYRGGEVLPLEEAVALEGRAWHPPFCRAVQALDDVLPDESGARPLSWV